MEKAEAGEVMTDDPERGYLVTLTLGSDPGSMRLPGELRSKSSSNHVMEVCGLRELGVDTIAFVKHPEHYLFRVAVGFRESAFREGEATAAYEAALRVVERLIMHRFLPQGLRGIPPTSTVFCRNNDKPTRSGDAPDLPRNIGRYYFITRHPEAGPGSAKSVLLDTNVLVDIERFFYSGIPADLRRDLHNLLLALSASNKLLMPGPALYESYRGRLSGPVDQTKLARSQYALHIVTNWNYEEFVTMFSRVGPPAELYPPAPSGPPAEWASEWSEFEGEGVLFDLMQIGGLAALLKVQTLTPFGRGFAGPEERLAAFRSFVEWATSSLQFMPPHEFQIAHDWFVGLPSRRTYVQRLLKFGHKDALRATWGAVWDLFLLKLIDSVSPMDSAFEGAVVVTRDRGLRALRQYCFPTSMEVVNADPDRPEWYGGLYATSIAVDPRLASRQEEIVRIWAEASTAQLSRIRQYVTAESTGEMENMLEYWRQEALALENQLRGRGRRKGK